YRYNSFPQIDILTASGVGGGSLIYSNVSIEPHQDPATGKYPVMEGWPLELTSDDFKNAKKWMQVNRGAPAQVVTKFPMPAQIAGDAVQQGYRDVNALLKNNPTLYLGRSRWLKEASEKLAAEWQQRKIADWEPLNLQVADYTGQPADPEVCLLR